MMLEDRKLLKKWQRYMSRSLIISVLMFLIGVIGGSMTNKLSGNLGNALFILFGLWYLIFAASGIFFYISLGKLASLLNKRWFQWVGLAFITSPIGIFVAYGMMNSRVEDALVGLPPGAKKEVGGGQWTE